MAISYFHIIDEISAVVLALLPHLLGKRSTKETYNLIQFIDVSFNGLKGEMLCFPPIIFYSFSFCVYLWLFVYM